MLLEWIKKWWSALFLIFINAFICSFVLNELNLEFIRKINPENLTMNTKSLVHNSTVWSIDNDWYLPYAENIIDGEGFTSIAHEPEMRVRRTPIYPLFFTVFYFLFGEQNAHFLIRYVQLLLHALSAVLIAMAIRNLFSNETWAKITGFIYGINIFIFSFSYYTLTEALYPFLIVLSIFGFSRFVKSNKRIDLLLCGLAVGIAFLCRATSGVVIVGFGLYLLFQKNVLFKQKIIQSVFLVFGFLSLLSPWVVRNYILTNELIVAEKYYHGATMNFGRSHIKVRELVSTWTNPANLSAELFSNTLRNNEVSGNHKANKVVIDDYLGQWPPYIFDVISKKALTNNLMEFANCLNEKEVLRKRYPKILRAEVLNLGCEDIVYSKLSLQKDSIIQKMPIQYYLITPLKSMKELVFNSFVHHFPAITILYKYHYYPGLLLKSGVFIFHVMLFLTCILFLFSKQLTLGDKLFLLAPILTLMIALTAFLFRYIESRYLLPIYPYLTISLSYGLFGLLKNFKNKLRKAK